MKSRAVDHRKKSSGKFPSYIPSDLFLYLTYDSSNPDCGLWYQRISEVDEHTDSATPAPSAERGKRPRSDDFGSPAKKARLCKDDSKRDFSDDSDEEDTIHQFRRVQVIHKQERKSQSAQTATDSSTDPWDWRNSFVKFPETQYLPSSTSFSSQHVDQGKKRDSDPALIPNRGAFFMHDRRSAAGQNGYRQFGQ